MNILSSSLAAALSLLTLAGASYADVHPAALFGDNMVLQRNMKIPVWGTADPAEPVTVTLGGETAKTVANAGGQWRVNLAPLPAGGPDTLTIAGKNTIAFTNVLIGDVWLCSGQSNMQYAMAWNMSYYTSDIASSNDPDLRSFMVQNVTATHPLSDLVPNAQQKWQAASPATVPYFTAVGYFFARELRKQLGVPIGIIASDWGGTNGESWVSRQALDANPALKSMADSQIQAMESYPQDLARFPGDMAQWEAKYNDADPGNTGEALGWASPSFDDSAWKTINLPMNFEQIGMKSGGSVWFRKTVNFPAESAGKGFTWNLSWSPENITAYFNGVQLAVSPSAPTPLNFTGPHSFTVPATLVHAGNNTLVLRIFSHSPGGYLFPATEGMGIPLTDLGANPDQWSWQIEHENAPLPADALSSLPVSPGAQPQNTASYIYNAQIAPLMPFAIRGVIWYQGENNVQRGIQYREILPTLIDDWRSRWGEGNFPFYIVQLTSYGGDPAQPSRSGWAEIREAQLMTAEKLPNTGVAVTIDAGEQHNIHPKDKQDVGMRLALIALAKTYHKNVVYSGPIYSDMTIKGDTAIITFKHTDGGLVAKGGTLKYFAIAGADKHFVWANAFISGDSVLVSSPQVPNPTAVRYAWADFPGGANLYNGAGLPASPFRTDPQDGDD